MSEQEKEDAWSPENVQIIQAITLMRIYDVLVFQLTLSDPEAAKEIMDIHATGALMTPSPHLSGQFMHDEMNKQ